MKPVQDSRARRINFVRSVLITVGIILAAEVIVAGLVGLVIVLPFPPSISDDARIACVFIPALLVVAVVIIWRSQVFRAQANPVETAFNTLGLIGSGYLWRGRQYHGKIDSRQVNVYFYRGPNLDINLAAQFNTLLGISLQGSISQATSSFEKLPELIIDDPMLPGLRIVAQDEAWCRALLSDRRVNAAILRLVAVQPEFESCSLLFYPDMLQFQLRWVNLSELSPGDVSQWMDDMLKLANIAESLPSPVVTSTISYREKVSRINHDYGLSPAGVCCGFFGFIALIIIVLVITILITEAGG